MHSSSPSATRHPRPHKLRGSSIAAIAAASLLWCTGKAVAETLHIMPLGASITQGYTDPVGDGYRAQLYKDLSKAEVDFQFIGSDDSNSSEMLHTAGQQWHNGYCGYRLDEIRANLDGSFQDPHHVSNRGGYWLTGTPDGKHPAVFPDIVLLHAGTNDLNQGASVEVAEERLSQLLKWFVENRPSTIVFVAKLVPTAANNRKIQAFDEWIGAHAPLFSMNIHVVDMYRLFVDKKGNIKPSTSPDGICLPDGIHPSHEGYTAMGHEWFKAINAVVLHHSADNVVEEPRKIAESVRRFPFGKRIPAITTLVASASGMLRWILLRQRVC